MSRGLERNSSHSCKLMFLYLCYFVTALWAIRCKFHFKQPGFIFRMKMNISTWSTVSVSIVSEMWTSEIANVQQSLKQEKDNKLFYFLIQFSECVWIHLQVLRFSFLRGAWCPHFFWGQERLDRPAAVGFSCCSRVGFVGLLCSFFVCRGFVSFYLVLFGFKHSLCFLHC